VDDDVGIEAVPAKKLPSWLQAGEWVFGAGWRIAEAAVEFQQGAAGRGTDLDDDCAGGFSTQRGSRRSLKT